MCDTPNDCANRADYCCGTSCIPRQCSGCDQKLNGTLSASSVHPNCGIQASNLDHEGLPGGWCAESDGGIGEWIQIDFGEQKEIAMIKTQGRLDVGQYVTRFMVMTSDDGVLWVSQGNKIGNWDQTTIAVTKKFFDSKNRKIHYL